MNRRLRSHNHSYLLQADRVTRLETRARAEGMSAEWLNSLERWQALVLHQPTTVRAGSRPRSFSIRCVSMHCGVHFSSMRLSKEMPHALLLGLVALSVPNSLSYQVISSSSVCRPCHNPPPGSSPWCSRCQFRMFLKTVGIQLRCAGLSVC
ncbi:hypothetical protein N657DRAFT_353409 [Parathielavia appendiculata]|uniref:Uncharacterized protein n=1 Tax=Parathielavia appendiculata TaxID=2587402 RepID=A0AAN6U2I0_9PEZI|nr:hypothetical protein N657DRAFT_353409 [Parathielavia appendiculata]